MDDIPISALSATLIFLIVLSAFFSGSETSLMTLNRYRLKHLAKSGNAGAVRAQELLNRPDRLIGLILLGNNFVNILASVIATLIAMRLWGETGIAIATGVLTLVLLIFGEVAPKTIAASHPERFAFPASFILKPLLKILYPLVWLTNVLSNACLRMMGARMKTPSAEQLTSDELRTVVTEAGAMIPRRHQKMLLSILDLEKVTVEDIMIPRNEIAGIDLDQDIGKVAKQIAGSLHTRLPVYEGDINNIVGMLHLKKILHAQMNNELTMEVIRNTIREPFFVPEGTPLHTVLQNFQAQKRRTGMVVDEYGEILGMITLEDILEEIVGEFTTDPSAAHRDIHPQEDGSYLVNGSINVRLLNKSLKLQLPTTGPKTLNGLIIEHMEAIPEPGTTILLEGYPIDIVHIKGNAVKTARIHPKLRRKKAAI